MSIDRQFVLFCGVGAAGFGVDVATLALTHNVLGVYGARLLSFLVAATATWLLNRYLTFRHSPAAVDLLREYVRYMGLMAGGGAVNYLVYSCLAWRFEQGTSWLFLYVAIGSIAGLAVNYLGASRWLYRPMKSPR